MTKQEIFDKVAPALIKQGSRCMVGPRCRYSDGIKRCAVGFLIPDGHPALESTGSVCFISNSYPELRFNAEQHFLTCLQHIHDSVDVHHWKTELKALAKSNNLNTECIDE